MRKKKRFSSNDEASTGREDRAQMWSTGGTAFHTSFDERPSAHGSHLSIYNSCTNLDEQEFQVIRTIFL
ncbi:unnamed protein product, partial [Mesorhabditis belari]|uniref:Uncharacterized protein n=1 Tax=Mesorhabditis belari TaxID=2138241 RepID=A0AAF3F6I5_9BILA